MIITHTLMDTFEALYPYRVHTIMKQPNMFQIWGQNSMHDYWLIEWKLISNKLKAKKKKNDKHTPFPGEVMNYDVFYI